MTSEPPGEDAVRFGSDYQDYFSPSAYCDAYYTTPDGAAEEKELGITMSTNWYTILSNVSFRGSRLLDIGTGPNLLSTIPASRYFSDICLSDYATPNRDAIQDWLNRKPEAHDWTPFFKFFSEKENIPDCTLLEKRTRAAITDVIPCDVTLGNPLSPLQTEPFDCITTSLCLEAAVQDDLTYKQAVKNVMSLLKPQGHFIQFGVLKESFYKVGAEKFFCHSLSKSLLEESMKEVNCTIHTLDNFSFSGEHDVSDFDGIFFLVAQKNL